MQIEVFEAIRDCEKWRHILGFFPEELRDVYFWPEYVALHCFKRDSSALMFMCKYGDKLWAYPFLLQPITHIGGKALENVWFDIETAYGYGGPLANTEDSNFLSAANQAFSEWCQKQNVVAEFVRLHPLLHNECWIDPHMELVHERETVSLRLDSVTGDKVTFNATTCNMLKRAERLEIRVNVFPARNHFAQFVRLYLNAMVRIKADKYYYFSNEYFHGLAQLVQENGWLIAAEQDGIWIAAAVFLRGPYWIHYHLSALDTNKRIPGATNTILYTAAQMGCGIGLERLHLGGGRTSNPDDSLLRFKKTMATDSHSFYIGKRTHKSDIYNFLKKTWEQTYPHLIPTYGKRLMCYRYGSEKEL